MKTPEKGYYRQLLAATHPNVRIAFTHTPIVGCTTIDSIPIIEALKVSTDEAAKYYIEGLENKTMVAIKENIPTSSYKNNGELYFKS